MTMNVHGSLSHRSPIRRRDCGDIMLTTIAAPMLNYPKGIRQAKGEGWKIVQEVQQPKDDRTADNNRITPYSPCMVCYTIPPSLKALLSYHSLMLPSGPTNPFGGHAFASLATLLTSSSSTSMPNPMPLSPSTYPSLTSQTRLSLM